MDGQYAIVTLLKMRDDSTRDMNEVVTLRVDWKYDDTLDTLKEWLSTQPYPVNVEVIKDSGPSGWPIAEISGKRRQVRGFILAEYLGGALDDMNGIVCWMADGTV